MVNAAGLNGLFLSQGHFPEVIIFLPGVKMIAVFTSSVFKFKRDKKVNRTKSMHNTQVHQCSVINLYGLALRCWKNYACLVIIKNRSKYHRLEMYCTHADRE